MNTEERKDKYVYVHKLDGVVVYIGSGGRFRCKSKTERSKEHLELWGALTKEVIASDLTENEARNLEQELINEKWDSGLLLNRTKTVDKTKSISYALFSQFLYYDETSPSCLRWKCDVARSAIKMNRSAGYCNDKGYHIVKLSGSLYRAHRIIFCLENKIDLDERLVIDHIDNNPSNNKISNLRLVTQTTNNKNKKHTSSNTGFQGISENLKNKSFRLSYTDGLIKQKTKSFSYYIESQKSHCNTNLYQTRQLALEAALNYRETLVESGNMVITSDKELNDQ